MLSNFSPLLEVDFATEKKLFQLQYFVKNPASACWVLKVCSLTNEGTPVSECCYRIIESQNGKGWKGAEISSGSNPSAMSMTCY